jgi:hypothetical protein
MPSFDTQRSAADGKRIKVDPEGRATGQPVARAEAKPPIDRIEVSTAARELAKVVTDPQPHLQLSQQQLKKMSTGREGDT